MAVFGLKYWAEMRSKHHNILWRVEIAERGYAGSSEEMIFVGDDPVLVTWEARGDEFYAPVKASEARKITTDAAERWGGCLPPLPCNEAEKTPQRD